MPFKDNLLQKIAIDKMAQTVRRSIGPPESGRKTDKETMLSLLETSPYTHRKERDLDLFVHRDEKNPEKILVLDNELALYQTSIPDVVLRKSPTIKEMVNIRNVIKILNDKDVVVAKKEVSIDIIQKECIDLLDLSFTKTEIDAIARDGAASLSHGYADGVLEALALFAELLEYHPPPKAFKMSGFQIIGAFAKSTKGEVRYGPVVVYSLTYNTLKLIDAQLGSFDKEKIACFHDVVSGKTDAAAEDSAVFEYLKKAVVQKHLVA